MTTQKNSHTFLKMLLLFSFLGVFTFAFGADGNVLQTFKVAFFKILNDYIVVIMVVIIVFGAAMAVYSGAPWMPTLIMTVGIVVVMFVFLDEEMIKNIGTWADDVRGWGSTSTTP